MTAPATETSRPLATKVQPGSMVRLPPATSGQVWSENAGLTAALVLPSISRWWIGIDAAISKTWALLVPASPIWMVQGASQVASSRVAAPLLR